MSDVSSTAADVKPLPGAVVQRYDAGGTVVAGNAVYIASDGDVEQADADGQASARAVGVVVCGPDGKTTFSSGDRVDVVELGPVAGFSSLTPATLLFSSVTAGAIADAAATAANDYIWVVGRAQSAAVVFVDTWTYDIAIIT